MYDEYGEFCGHLLINQREWQIHYFNALDTKPSSDSVIDLVIYRANRARYVYDHETVEATPKFIMTSEPDYGQLHPRLGWLSIDAIEKETFKHTTQLACSHAHEYHTQEMIQVSESRPERASS
jgi:hypothetical protein